MRLVMPLFESVLAAVLAEPGCVAWLGSVRCEFVEDLRADVDKLCREQGW
jgi:hypothetical protein